MPVLLVATDGSLAAGAALDEAIRLAAETGDEIAAITVWRALQGDFGLAYPSAAMLDDLLDAERRHAEAALRDASERAGAAGVQLTTRLATGDPAEQICARAEELARATDRSRDPRSQPDRLASPRQRLERDHSSRPVPGTDRPRAAPGA